MTLRTCVFAAGAVLAISASGCGIIESSENGLQARIPVTFTIPQEIIIALPSAEQLQTLPEREDGSRIVPMCDGSGENSVCVPAPHFADMNLATLDESGTIEDVRDRIRGIEITGISTAVDPNTLPSQLQPIEIRIGSLGSDFANSLIVGNTAVYAVGEIGTQDATIVDTNLVTIGEYLGNFEFALGMGTSLEIPSGAVPDSGSATIFLTMSIDLIVSPL